MAKRSDYVILLVDDEERVLAGLRRRLMNAPYTIFTASSGADALDLLDGLEVDAVVSDQDMPGMTGTELLKTVRERQPTTVRFMLTGKPSLEVAIEAINKGEITRFFTKPCDVADLLLSLQQALRQKELLEEARRLLARARYQEQVLEELVSDPSGLLEVDREADGTILLEEMPTDLDELCDAIQDLLRDAPVDEMREAG